MQLWGLIADDEAVSPVIGIILMVAITVILATVIGTFVLGVGESAPQEQPQVSWRFNFSPVGDSYGDAASGDRIAITHASGDVIEENTGVKIGPSRVTESGSQLSFVNGGFSFPIGSGQTVTVEETGGDAMQAGDYVLVIYRPDKPAVRTIVGERELP